MKLYNFFLLILSFTCTLSTALPAGSSQCVPVNADDAPLRNINGAGISLFSNQVRINIVQAEIEPGGITPYGGFMVSIINDYCRAIAVTFRWPSGETFVRAVSPGSSWLRSLIPRRAAQGTIFHVSIHDQL
jgi:hypothetical protein